MPPLRCLHQEMQVLEIIVVPCQEKQTVANGVEKMPRICRAGQPRVGRHHDLVPGLAEPGNEGALGADVIEIEIHALAAAGAAAGAYGHLSRPADLIPSSSRARSALSKSLFL